MRRRPIPRLWTEILAILLLTLWVGGSSFLMSWTLLHLAGLHWSIQPVSHCTVAPAAVIAMAQGLLIQIVRGAR